MRIPWKEWIDPTSMVGIDNSTPYSALQMSLSLIKNDQRKELVERPDELWEHVERMNCQGEHQRLPVIFRYERPLSWQIELEPEQECGGGMSWNCARLA